MTTIYALVAVITFSVAPVAAAWAGDAPLRLDGAGVSQLGADLRVLTVGAEADDPGSADGIVPFVHVAPVGVSRFVGAVTCLAMDDGSKVQLSGSVLDGVTAAGVVLTGKDFLFTLEVNEGAQSFSLPAFADAGVRGRCSGGSANRVAANYGGFVLDRP